MPNEVFNGLSQLPHSIPVQCGWADSALGPFWSIRSPLGLHGFQPGTLPDQLSLPKPFHAAPLVHADDSWTRELIEQLMHDPQRPLSLPLAPIGTPFQLKVWQALTQIPYGDTATYRDIAQAIQQANACRAVGSAIGKNPIAYWIPCHRIIRADHSLGGYRWGTKLKKQFLIQESFSE